MAFVMTTDGSTGCNHGGGATLKSDAKLTVNHAPVLLAADVASWPIKPGCSQTNSQGGEKICTKFTAQTAGVAGKLKVGGKPVVLDGFAATTDGLPKFDSKKAGAGQNKLSAV